MTATAVSSLPISLPPYGSTRPQAALRHTKKVHDLELTQKQQERERYPAQLEDSEFKEREPFEHFAEFLLGNSGLGAYERVEIYERLIRHLKNCKLTKLTVALEKMKAEWDAEDEQETA